MAVGAVINTAQITPGSIAIVFGAGGVGLNAIQGCAIAGAAMIVAVGVAVGVAGMKDQTSIRTASLTFEEKTLKGSYFGGARPREDFPRLMSLYRSGRLKLKELITHRYSVEQAQQAFDDLSSGRNARGMILFGEV